MQRTVQNQIVSYLIVLDNQVHDLQQFVTKANQTHSLYTCTLYEDLVLHCPSKSEDGNCGRTSAAPPQGLEKRGFHWWCSINPSFWQDDSLVETIEKTARHVHKSTWLNGGLLMTMDRRLCTYQMLQIVAYKMANWMQSNEGMPRKRYIVQSRVKSRLAMCQDPIPLLLFYQVLESWIAAHGFLSIYIDFWHEVQRSNRVRAFGAGKVTTYSNCFWKGVLFFMAGKEQGKIRMGFLAGRRRRRDHSIQSSSNLHASVVLP